MLTTADVTFEPKSPWQKDDCIGGCGDPSTIEAVASSAETHPETTSRVRCRCPGRRC